MKNNKLFKKLAAVLISASMIAAMGISVSADSVAEEASYKDTLVIGDNTEPKNLDPDQSWGAAEARFSAFIHEGLVREDADGNIIPLLATDWTVSDDGLTYTFNLKENYIVHLDINGCQHWTVIRKVTDTHVFLADSTEGNINFTIDEFNSYFTKKAIIFSKDSSIDLEKEIISNQIKILDENQCLKISGKGLKKIVVGYRIVWKYGFIQKYGWVLKPKVVGGHVSFSQW